MKTIINLGLALTLLVATTTIVLGQTQTLEETQTPASWVTHETDQYSITYPSNWTIDSSGLMGTKFFLFSVASDSEDNFKENVNLITQDLTGYDVAMDELVKSSEDMIGRLITDANIVLSQRKTHQGQEYHQMVYTGKQGIMDLKFAQCYWLINHTVYVLTFTCERGQYDNFQALADQILTSFTVK